MSVGDVTYRGHCKWFDSKKGYGFISTEDGIDLFVHQSEIKSGGFRNLAEGEKVEFSIETCEDGRKKAVNVTGPGGSQVQGERRRLPARPNSDVPYQGNSGDFRGGGRGQNWNDMRNGNGNGGRGSPDGSWKRRDYENWRS